MTERDPVITGFGTVAPDGTDLEHADRLAARVRDGVPVPSRARLVAARLDVEKLLPARALRKVSEHTRLVAVASALALRDAGLRDTESGVVVGAREIGVCIGTSFGSSEYHLECHEALRRRGVPGASALLFSQSVFNAAPGHLGQVFGLMGSNAALVGGESVGLEAIHRAASRLRSGSPETAMIAGGGEQYTDLVHASLFATGLVGDDPSGSPGPFAEGAAVCVLESRASAASRGVRNWADVVGGAARSGGFEQLPATAVVTLDAACQRGSVGRAELDLVVVCPPAHAEAPDVLARCGTLGARYLSMAPRAKGEGFSFTSALAVVDAVLSIAEQSVLPTLDPLASAARLDVDVCPREFTATSLRHVGVVAMTSRGSVTALVLRCPTS